MYHPQSLGLMALVVILGIAVPPQLRGDAAPVPFGSDLKVPTPKDLRAETAATTPIDCFSAANAGGWVTENPVAGQSGNPFTITPVDGKDAVSLTCGQMTPARTTVRIMLPGDAPANGAIWSKQKDTLVSFLCKSTKPAEMTCHLLQHGKTAGTYQTGFTASPGGWQHETLPISDFGLKSFASISGIGFRLASADPDAVVSIADVSVGGVAYTDDSWKDRRLSISIDGDWRFATDPGEQGSTEKWYADAFNDSSWKVIKSGQAWEDQGIVHHGYGWYRQKIFIPKDFAGTPLTLTLTQIPSDDDAWFNGTRVGGWSGEYKYANQMLRAYTVPASLIHYGELNTIAIRIWGGNLGFIGAKSGLIKGPLTADLDPYGVSVKEGNGPEVPIELYDFSEAQHGKPFVMIFRLPPELAQDQHAQFAYHLSDENGIAIKSGQVPLAIGADKNAQAVVPIDGPTAQTIYLRGRFRADVLVQDSAGNLIYSGTKRFDRLSFTSRDNNPLPALPDAEEQTPYGSLKLVDTIDCSTAPVDEIHPYMQGSFIHSQDHMTPGSDVDVRVNDILGKKARESAFGWWAYRIGRGELKPHTTYLLRIEYPEDKPRFCPMEIQTGQIFMDVGWRNGVSPDDPYDNWPLSHAWQSFDVIVPLDDKTVGTGGTGSAFAKNGFWIYFMNQMKPGMYFSMYSGGPAIASVRLYEIDPEKNAPVIQRPQGLPQRVLSFDWERQPDHDPADLVRYAKLMGYSAISPIVLKWGTANYSDPLNGYTSVNTDDHRYWAWMRYDPTTGQPAQPAVPGKESIHARYLDATKQYGIDYIPRVEYGGSDDLPKDAWALDVNGQPMKPDRFGTWGADLLNPATWDDMKKLVDHLYLPYVKDNPQLKGMLWRIRQDRMPISYSKADIQMFCQDTNTPYPPGGDEQAAAWAAGDMKTKYDDWWHQKREQFHAKLVDLLKSYRSDMTLYYYNWDADKYSLILPDTNSAAFFVKLAAPPPNGGLAAYQKDREERKSFTATDYISVLHTGNFGEASKGINRADYGIRPELYKDLKGIQLFCPANYLCYAGMPDYLNYFQTAEGLAASNVVPYDEFGARSINPKFEGTMLVPGGPPFSMAVELLTYFNGDARTLNFTAYTYGRGFADVHRRFAQAFLALPAIPGVVVDQGDVDLKVRKYDSTNGTYLGVAFKGYTGKKLTINVPGVKAGAKVTNLVTNQTVTATASNGGLQFEVDSGPIELNAYLIK